MKEVDSVVANLASALLAVREADIVTVICSSSNSTGEPLSVTRTLKVTEPVEAGFQVNTPDVAFIEAPTGALISENVFVCPLSTSVAVAVNVSVVFTTTDL